MKARMVQGLAIVGMAIMLAAANVAVVAAGWRLP